MLWDTSSSVTLAYSDSFWHRCCVNSILHTKNCKLFDTQSVSKWIRVCKFLTSPPFPCMAWRTICVKMNPSMQVYLDTLLFLGDPSNSPMSVCPCMALIWRLKKALTALPVLYLNTWLLPKVPLVEPRNCYYMIISPKITYPWWKL